MTFSDYVNRGSIPTPGCIPVNSVKIDNDQRKGILEDGDIDNQQLFEATDENNRMKRILKSRDENHDQLNCILDATASLPVADPKKQVVAVVLHVGNTTLIIAENSTVRDGLAEHITELWGLLQDKANGNAKKCWELTFRKYAYCDSAPKNPERYKTWIPKLKEFLSAIPISATDPSIDKFRQIVRDLEATHKFLNRMKVEKPVTNTLETKNSLNDRNHLLNHMAGEDWDAEMKRMAHVVYRYSQMFDHFKEHCARLDPNTELE